MNVNILRTVDAKHRLSFILPVKNSFLDIMDLEFASYDFEYLLIMSPKLISLHDKRVSRYTA